MSTNKQYLIDITLKSLTIEREHKSPTKVICEIYYGQEQNLLKIKLEPLLKNGIAMFYEERIRIPYTPQIAIAFKLLKAKKQSFLGHCKVDVGRCLEDKVFSLKLNQKLQQTQAWVDFQIKIIDQSIFCDEQSDYLDDSNMFPLQKSIHSQDGQSKSKIFEIIDYKSKSDDDIPFKIIKDEGELLTPLPEEFGKNLLQVQSIMYKHKLIQMKQVKVYEYRASRGKNQYIQSLEDHLNNAKANGQINGYLIICIAAVIGFYIGLIIKFE